MTSYSRRGWIGQPNMTNCQFVRTTPYKSRDQGVRGLKTLKSAWRNFCTAPKTSNRLLNHHHLPRSWTPFDRLAHIFLSSPLLLTVHFSLLILASLHIQKKSISSFLFSIFSAHTSIFFRPEASIFRWEPILNSTTHTSDGKIAEKIFVLSFISIAPCTSYRHVCLFSLLWCQSTPNGEKLNTRIKKVNVNFLFFVGLQLFSFLLLQKRCKKRRIS